MHIPVEQWAGIYYSVAGGRVDRGATLVYVLVSLEARSTQPSFVKKKAELLLGRCCFRYFYAILLTVCIAVIKKKVYNSLKYLNMFFYLTV